MCRIIPIVTIFATTRQEREGVRMSHGEGESRCSGKDSLRSLIGGGGGLREEEEESQTRKRRRRRRRKRTIVKGLCHRRLN
jgi:hypothetical protein